MSVSSKHPARTRMLTVVAAAGLVVGAFTVGYASSSASPANCGSACLSAVGVADLPAATVLDNLTYSFSVTNQGADDTLTSFTIDSTRPVFTFNDVSDVSVNGVAVPNADLDELPGNDPYATKINLPTPITGRGGQATVKFVLGEPLTIDNAPTRTTLTAKSQSGQSVTSAEVRTPYPTVDVAARYVGDTGIPDPAIGNAKAIEVHIPVFSAGTGPAPKARFTFTLGTGWSAKHTTTALGPDVSCTSVSTTWTCDELTPIDNEVSWQSITLVPAATAGINVVRTFHIHITPIGVNDQVPSNNDITLGVLNTGTADTGRTLAVGATRLKVGEKTTVTVVVLNRGPQTTNRLQVLVVHDGTHTTDHVVMSSGKGSGVFTGYDAGAGATGYAWYPPAMAPGKSYTATFTLTARLTGTGWVSITTHAVTYDPDTEGVTVKSPPIIVS